MKLSISNIAWDVEEDLAVAALLERHKISAIDVAPGKYFPTPARVKEEAVERVRRWWTDHGIEIAGMQALLFGTTGLNMFSDSVGQDAMLEHLRSICGIGGGLGATRLVFGSPKNRDRSGLSDVEALEQAVCFFRRLGDIAQEHGVIICLEANPVQYGANFMTTTRGTMEVVNAVSHKSIRMQFDTGAIAINEESPETVLMTSARLVGHIHASEPNLVPLGDAGTDHHSIGRLLRKHLPDHIVSVEMVAAKSEPHLQAMERALVCADACYRNARETAR